MNIEAINKIEDAQALLSILEELVNIDPVNNYENLNHGALLIIQSIDKTLVESKGLLMNSGQ
jgi:hypothetical protein